MPVSLLEKMLLCASAIAAVLVFSLLLLVIINFRLTHDSLISANQILYETIY